MGHELTAKLPAGDESRMNVERLDGQDPQSQQGESRQHNKGRVGQCGVKGKGCQSGKQQALLEQGRAFLLQCA